jgi:hypothetical protein
MYSPFSEQFMFQEMEDRRAALQAPRRNAATEGRTHRWWPRKAVVNRAAGHGLAHVAR